MQTRDDAAGSDGVKKIGELDVNPLATISLESLSATRMRPLFNATRRPPSLEAHASAPKPVLLAEPVRDPDFVLVGTAIDKAESLAIFEEKATGGTFRLRVGATHDKWTLVTMSDRAVELTSGASKTTLSLSFGKLPVAATASDSESRRKERDSH